LGLYRIKNLIEQAEFFDSFDDKPTVVTALKKKQGVNTCTGLPGAVALEAIPG